MAEDKTINTILVLLSQDVDPGPHVEDQLLSTPMFDYTFKSLWRITPKFTSSFRCEHFFPFRMLEQLPIVQGEEKSLRTDSRPSLQRLCSHLTCNFMSQGTMMKTDPLQRNVIEQSLPKRTGNGLLFVCSSLENVALSVSFPRFHWGLLAVSSHILMPLPATKSAHHGCIARRHTNNLEREISQKQAVSIHGVCPFPEKIPTAVIGEWTSYKRHEKYQ